MGWFSSKKKTVVNTTVQRIFEDTAIPNSIQTGTIKSILQSGDLNEYIMEELASSLGVRAARGYLWAKTNDYAFGVPEAKVNSVVSAKGIVLSTIAAQVGQTITPDYYKFGPLNSIHYAWTWIIANIGYNPTTNELFGFSATVGYPCFLTNMVATYPQEDYDFIQQTNDYEMLAQWGPAPNSGYTPTNPFNYLGGIGQYAAQSNYVVSPTATDPFVTITYEYKNAQGVIVKTSLNAVLPVDLSADYHQVRYMKADGSYAFWTYQEGAGTYPDIDGAYAMQFDNLGTYLPWCYFRHGDRRVKDRSTHQYEHAKKWAKYLGVDYDSIDEGVAADPDVDDVEQSFMMFGVHPGAQHESELTYLFEYFNILHFNSLAQAELAGSLPEKIGNFSSSPSQVQVIQDRIFKMLFQYSGITKQRKPGKIAPLGKFTGTYESAVNGGTVMGQMQPAYVFRKQVLDSVYEEVAVFGLRTTYEVTSKKGHTANSGDPELLVPVDRTLLQSLSMRNREQLLSRALYMVVNTKVTIKTPWYASTFFKVILIVVAVVITILSAGSAWASIVAAAAVGYTALAITVLTLVLSTVAVNYAVKLFVKEVGPEIGFIAAVAAMAFGAYAGSNIDGASWWGDALVNVGNNMVPAATAEQKALIDDVQQDILAFQDYAKGEFDSLKEQRDQLGLNPELFGLSGLDFVRMEPAQVWGETPNDLYNRTVHSGNIGASSYGITTNYVDFMLKLPTINDMSEVPENGVPE